MWDADSGAIRQELPGYVDVEAVAAGAADCPWRARPRKLETMVERASDDHVVAWFPASRDDIATHPSGRVWAGGAGNHL
jgi:hypothetical protein